MDVTSSPFFIWKINCVFNIRLKIQKYVQCIWKIIWNMGFRY